MKQTMIFHLYHQGIQSIVLVSLILIGACYDLKCPVQSQRQHRSNNSCQIVEAEYMCIRDVFTFQHIELCAPKRHFQRPGYIIVWSGNFDGQVCDSQRYQPIRYFNSDGSDCILKKSVCNEEGQLLIEDGSPISDRRCRCDYRRGYSFVTDPSNKCTCIPSIEDCSCYLKHCPKFQELSPDYKCIWKDEIHEHFNCTRLLDREVDYLERKMEKLTCTHVTSADWKLLTDEKVYTESSCIIHTIYIMISLVILNGMAFFGLFVFKKRQKGKCSDNADLVGVPNCKNRKLENKSTDNKCNKRNTTINNSNQSSSTFMLHLTQERRHFDRKENMVFQLKQVFEPNLHEQDVNICTFGYAVLSVDSKRQIPYNEIGEKFEIFCREYGYHLIKQLSYCRPE